MSFHNNWGAAPALAFALLCAAGPAGAGVVHVTVASGEFGQGWMFLDRDGHCKVVTAAHVVRGLGGRLRPPVITDDHGHIWGAGSDVLLSEPLDIAVLAVPSADRPADCGDGRLSAIGAAGRVAAMAGAVIRMAEGGAVVDLPVAHRASSMDTAAGEHFSVRPALPGDVIRKGLSGSVVLDADGPLGIVTDVDAARNEAVAVRVDAIRDMIDQQTSSSGAPAIGAGGEPLLSGIAAASPDPQRGPQQSLAGSRSAWRAVPDQRLLTLIATFAAPRQVSDIALSNPAAQDNAIEAVDIGTQAGLEERDWTEGNYCPAPRAPSLDCRLLVRTVLRVRVLIKTRNDTPIDVAGLVVR